MIELSLSGRGPRRAFVFDEHRFALPCWAAEPGPAVLVSFDRHFDTVPNVNALQPGESLETFTRERLDRRNYDHIPAALQCGVLSSAILIARARPQGSALDARYVHAPTLDVLLEGPDRARAFELLEAAKRVVLDFDLDCFTTPSDADPTTAVPWPLELIREHVLPRGAEGFWELALKRCDVLTFAREPKHTGGLVASGRLFEAAAQVVFVELLGADLP
ncbi:MAG: hypothetical protein JNK82_07685 [Myxococcaceae bacterium]|nr:hypothetical protein [Myxococcaceae bacterium]